MVDLENERSHDNRSRINVVLGSIEIFQTVIFSSVKISLLFSFLEY